jgi:hypothetical protein
VDADQYGPRLNPFSVIKLPPAADRFLSPQFSQVVLVAAQIWGASHSPSSVTESPLFSLALVSPRPPLNAKSQKPFCPKRVSGIVRVRLGFPFSKCSYICNKRGFVFVILPTQEALLPPGVKHTAFSARNIRTAVRQVSQINFEDRPSLQHRAFMIGFLPPSSSDMKHASSAFSCTTSSRGRPDESTAAPQTLSAFSAPFTSNAINASVACRRRALQYSTRTEMRYQGMCK